MTERYRGRKNKRMAFNSLLRSCKQATLRWSRKGNKVELESGSESTYMRTERGIERGMKGGSRGEKEEEEEGEKKSNEYLSGFDADSLQERSDMGMGGGHFQNVDLEGRNIGERNPVKNDPVNVANDIKINVRLSNNRSRRDDSNNRSSFDLGAGVSVNPVFAGSTSSSSGSSNSHRKETSSMPSSVGNGMFRIAPPPTRSLLSSAPALSPSQPQTHIHSHSQSHSQSQPPFVPFSSLSSDSPPTSSVSSDRKKTSGSVSSESGVEWGGFESHL